MKKAKGIKFELFDFPTIQKQLKISARFLAAFLLSFFIFYIVLSFFPIEIFEHFTAMLSSVLLGLFGYSTKIASGEPVQIVVNGKYVVEISYLCTGLLESILVASAIVASLGISLRKRIAGIIGGLFFVNFLNVFRIAVTVHAIASIANTAYIDFIHNALFRLTLFIGIACYYAAWFLLATRHASIKKRPKTCKQ